MTLLRRISQYSLSITSAALLMVSSQVVQAHSVGHGVHHLPRLSVQYHYAPPRWRHHHHHQVQHHVPHISVYHRGHPRHVHLKHGPQHKRIIIKRID